MSTRRFTKLKARIIQAGLCQIDVSQASGISENRVSSFVKGRRKPNQDEIRKLAEVLDCTTEEILSDL